MTPGEKVEIAWMIEQAMEGRQGQRTDLQPKTEKEHVPTLEQVNPGTKTVEIAAAAVGMKKETYRKAKAVVNSGNQEVIQAMDSGEKSVNAAVAVGRVLT